MQPIVVLGAGSWGTALSLHLARNGNEVRLWSHQPDFVSQLIADRENKRFLPDFPFPEQIHPMVELKTVFDSEPSDVLMAVPSFAFEEVLDKIKPFVNASTRLLWATKGLTESGQLLHEVAIAKGYHYYGVLSGPSFAKEVAKGVPTAISLATNDADFTQAMTTRFHSTHFRVYASDDIVGIELGGAIKNVLAIAASLTDGLGLGMNTKAALITRGVAELRRLSLAMGAHPETAMGLSGMGDIILTCSDNQSRNRRFGLFLAQGHDVDTAEKKVGQVVEGRRNAAQVVQLFKAHQLDAPICQMVFDIIEGNVQVKDAVEQLLSRPPAPEFS